MQAFPKSILVHWPVGLEAIELSRRVFTNKEHIRSTSEWWYETGESYVYNTHSVAEVLADGKLRLSIQYQKSDNKSLPRNRGIRFGTSELIFAKGATRGRATWLDEDPDYETIPAHWQSTAATLIAPRTKTVVSKTDRAQERFRRELRAFGNSCAISGETTPDVLEAAHIIPVKRNGADVPMNGMLLRADLHRLYDAGHFKIDVSGHLIPTAELSKTYKTLLAKREKLAPETLARILPALKIVNKR